MCPICGYLWYSKISLLLYIPVRYIDTKYLYYWYLTQGFCHCYIFLAHQKYLLTLLMLTLHSEQICMSWNCFKTIYVTNLVINFVDCLTIFQVAYLFVINTLCIQLCGFVGNYFDSQQSTALTNKRRKINHSVQSKILNKFFSKIGST